MAEMIVPAGSASGTPRRMVGSSWIVSITAICFIFGGLLAMQLRTIQQVHANQQEQVETTHRAEAQLQQMQQRLANEKQSRQQLEGRIASLNKALDSDTRVSKAQAKQLSAQIKQLQRVGGFTAVQGPGVVVVLRDNPEAAKAGGNNPFLPGIVHDYDLLQVVNELRAAKAEAISINRRRVTGFTPIRCVGPTINVNWEGVAPPFRIEAIGDPDVLEPALRMPDGILDNLQNSNMGPGIGVEIRRSNDIRLAASEFVPSIRVARNQEPAATP